jgi:8-oxo-dGTP diphosphatase
VIIRTCLCLVTRPAVPAGPDGGREVLLGFKKSGFGAGRWVGLGGHIEDGERPAEAATREVAEESGLIVSELEHMASLNFTFPARPAWNQTADVFMTSQFSGQAAESDEVVPRWFAADALPFDGMWDDARYWVPLVLAGQHVAADITFADDCATVAATSPAYLLSASGG